MTNEITKKAQDLLNDTKNRSLSQKMTDLKSKIANINKYKNLTLLCDVSGSMDARVSNHESNEYVKAIDVLNNIVKDFQEAKVFEFSSVCREVQQGQTMQVKGSTNMGLAFAVIKQHQIKEIILLTDGVPDDENRALQEAKGLKINIIYIGPAPVPEFLRKLAALTSGKFEDVDLIRIGTQGQEQIENKIKGFLSA